MADRSILYRIRAALQGNFVAVADEVELTAAHVGVISGATDVATAVARFDGTGIGSSIFQFSGSYSAQASNISEWFGDRQQTRLRCIDNSGISPVTFSLPGSTALGTAFDTLVANGLPEVIRFVIEYTGPTTTFLRVIPRAAPSPQIVGTTAIIVRSSIGATVEVTRTSGTISDYVFQAIGQIGDVGGGTVDALKLINPATEFWDATDGATLPSSSVVKGNAYRVANAPSDGSGRFGEVMENGDWVVWEGASFTSWAAEPHLWFVLPAHDVRRVSALGTEFLNDVALSTVSDRNAVIRGANYADSAGEIRLKIYPTRADYTAADLNTTGDIDEFTDLTSTTGYLAIRLTGTLATVQSVLPTLYVYEDNAGTFTKLINLNRDFTYEGDFGAESDYLSNASIDYVGGTTLKIYIGEDVDRFNAPNLDVRLENLSDELQQQLESREPWASTAGVFFSGSSVRDILVADRIDYSPGYSKGVDWRDMANSTTINENRYLDGALSISVNLAAFTLDGFGNSLQKIVGITFQRNDGQTGEGAMMEIGLSSAFLRVNTSNQLQVNTAVGGTPNWVTFSDGGSDAILSSGDNYLLFEMVPTIPGDFTRWDVVADFYDGTNRQELNNVIVTPEGNATGDNLGFSRSSNQRGQVLNFSAINSPGYLTHSQLDTVSRQHRSDKWNLGFARLIEGSTTKEVDIATRIRMPDFVLASPGGTEYTLTVADDGTLKTTEVV